MHPEVEAILNEIETHRLHFTVLCRGLTMEELCRPVPNSSWQVRDFIAHLATIDGPVEQMFQAMHAGTQGSGASGSNGEKWDVDRYNNHQVEVRRDRTVNELLVEAAEKRTRLRSTLASLTAEDLEKTLHFGGDGKRPATDIRFGDYLKGWAKHDPMHAVDMMRAMPEKMSPRLEKWFDDPAVRGYQKAMNAKA